MLFAQDIQDWVKLRGYTPSSEIVQLTEHTTMVDSSRRLFYVNHPIVADKETFNTHCRENEHSIVLGCYLPGQNGIFLLDVQDERLEGIKQVTAAHEFLHAAYERLSASERRRINALLQVTYENMKDPRIIETIELYRKQDPSIVENEMHSIFGSEVRNLPRELEEYYGRYFSNRLEIVRYAEKYEQAFTDRRNKIRQYDEELSRLKQQIDAATEKLRAQNDELKNMRNQMNSYRSSGRTEQYNELVPVYNNRVGEFNALIDSVSVDIVKYNGIVQQRNEIASEEAELVEAIDSREVVPTQR